LYFKYGIIIRRVFFMNNNGIKSTRGLIIASMGIVLNIVLGTAVGALKIPMIFLDTIGTIFVAAFLGPLAGAFTGGLTNIIQGMMTNPKNIPFAIVNITVGLIVGCVAKRWKFGYKQALITGLVLSVVAPLIGSPIAVYMFSGLTGGGTDLIVAWLVATGNRIFAATFISRIWGNLIDKTFSCLLVAFLLTRIPKNLLSTTKSHAQK
jgi:energy-coupling factor transport system substrate-specific component